MSLAPDYAAKFVLRKIRQYDEDQWNEILDYLMDYFPQYEELDLDEIEKLNKRQVSILILEHALKLSRKEKKQIPVLQYDQTLARRWIGKKEKNKEKKRTRVEISAQTKRENARLDLIRSKKNLPSCTLVPIVNRLFMFEMQIMLDPSIPDNIFGVKVPQSWIDASIGNLIKIETKDLFVVYARPFDYYKNGENNNILYVSQMVYQQLGGGIKRKEVMVQICSPITKEIGKIEFTLFSDKDMIVPPDLEANLSMILSKMPAVSLGMEIISPSGDNVLVTEIKNQAGQNVFMAALPEYGYQDIPYSVAVVNSDLVAFSNCICGNEATLVCSQCRVAMYCDNEMCTDTDWKDSHKLLCGWFI